MTTWRRTAVEDMSIHLRWAGDGPLYGSTIRTACERKRFVERTVFPGEHGDGHRLKKRGHAVQREAVQATCPECLVLFDDVWTEHGRGKPLTCRLGRKLAAIHLHGKVPTKRKPLTVTDLAPGTNVRFLKNFITVIPNKRWLEIGGMTGTVVAADERLVAIRITSHDLDILAEWHNEVVFTNRGAFDALDTVLTKIRVVP
jgi:hypothetical protein